MPLLKRSKERNEVVYIGAMIPQYTFQYITLYALAKRTTKTSIFKPLVDAWIKENKEEGIDEKELVLEIVDLVKRRWAYEKVNNKRADLFIFKMKMKKELKLRGLNDHYVSIIIETIK
jgi:hypothetical protein